jgi:hypothetical protein
LKPVKGSTGCGQRKIGAPRTLRMLPENLRFLDLVLPSQDASYMSAAAWFAVRIKGRYQAVSMVNPNRL